MTNANGVALGKLRWAKKTEAERKAHSEMMNEARWGKAGRKKARRKRGAK